MYWATNSPRSIPLATGALAVMEKQHLEDAKVCQDLRTELNEHRTELRALSASLAYSEAEAKTAQATTNTALAS